MSDVIKLHEYVQCSQCGVDMIKRGDSALQWCGRQCYDKWHERPEGDRGA